MPKEVPAGAHAGLTRVVEEPHTLRFHHPELPPVLSTPYMIAWMETACYHALQPYALEGEITVGTAVNVKHYAPTTIGREVTADATLESVNGRFHVMRVTARQGDTLIGEGTIDRAFINVKKFLQKA